LNIKKCNTYIKLELSRYVYETGNHLLRFTLTFILKDKINVWVLTFGDVLRSVTEMDKTMYYIRALTANHSRKISPLEQALEAKHFFRDLFAL
jgi:hypothetical protein